MPSDENNTPVPAPEAWAKLSPKARYAAEEDAEYDPFDIETLANEPC